MGFHRAKFSFQRLFKSGWRQSWQRLGKQQENSMVIRNVLGMYRTGRLVGTAPLMTIPLSHSVPRAHSLLVVRVLRFMPLSL